MRELKPIWDDGDATALILVPTSDEDSGDGQDLEQKFRLPLTDDVRTFLSEHFGLITPSVENSAASSDAVLEAAAKESAPSTDTSPEPTSPQSPVASSSQSPVASSSRHKSTAGVDKLSTSSSSYAEPRVVLSPREIQDRIRSGSSVEELIEFSGMQRKKIETFAYPVMAERNRISELGKKSRPRRQDGVSKLPLWEVLATAFAARGQDLEDSTWDAYRNNTGQWIITVTWDVGHTTNVAEWNYQAEGSAAISIARNELAAELIDPNYARRTRDLAPADDKEESTSSNTVRSIERQASMPQAWQQKNNASAQPGPIDDDELDFLQHPEERPHKPKRQKKTVMPSWDDVLLGVRPNHPKK